MVELRSLFRRFLGEKWFTFGCFLIFRQYQYTSLHG
nr:MAG TPA: hypothetical protein [Siphoviridae sp. ctBfm1]